MHANYNIIKKIKETVKIPVIVNGGIATFKDV
jgi:tRNA-dihydrouridine synthase